MAITQKRVKEEIANAEKMIADTVVEKNALLEKIREEVGESNKIDPTSSESIKSEIDEYNGLMSTITYYTGHLNALNWVLKEMKSKNRKKD